MERFSSAVSEWTGGTLAFVLALGVIVAWLVTGPVFHYSDTWQLVINTSTTIVTFLMVFLIQRAQNKEARAASVKLNELLAAMKGASNSLINAEDLSEHDLRRIRDRFKALSTLVSQDADNCEAHSIEEEQSRNRQASPEAPGPAGPGTSN